MNCIIDQISALGISGDYPSAWELLAQVYPVPRLGGGGCEFYNIDDPKVNDDFKKIAGSTNHDQRKQLFQDLYNRVATDAGVIWLGETTDLVTIRNDLVGYHYNFTRGSSYIPLEDISVFQ